MGIIGHTTKCTIIGSLIPQKVLNVDKNAYFMSDYNYAMFS